MSKKRTPNKKVTFKMGFEMDVTYDEAKIILKDKVRKGIVKL